MSSLKIAAIFAIIGGAIMPLHADDNPPSTPEQTAQTEQTSSSVSTCPDVGKGYFNIPGTSTCVAIKGSITGNVEHDIADDNLVVQTQYVGDTPFALYDTAEVPRSDRLTRMSAEAVMEISTVTPTSKGLAIAYLSLAGSVTSDFYSLMIEQASLNWNNITVGLHQSFFDFTPGYNNTAGYSSNEQAVLLAYEKDIGLKGALSLSIEDNGSRITEEGVWASRAGQNIPSVVLSGRYSSEHLTWQTAFAATSLEDAQETVCCGYPRGEFGWAAQTSVELRKNYGKQSGRFMVGAAYTDGALSYLGPILFASDYIVDSDGTIVKTKGASAIASYEHTWRADLRSAVSVSGFKTWTRTKDFDWDTFGLQATAGIEYIPASNILLGVEGSYYRDSVQGTYFDAKGSLDTVDFLRGRLYMKRTF
jgi:opacity protein-like surface antigen